MTGERGDLQGTEQAAEKSLNHVLPLSVCKGKTSFLDQLSLLRIPGQMDLSHVRTKTANHEG